MDITRGKFYGIGVGPGDPNLLTIRAVEVLKSVEFVAIPKSRMDRDSVAWEIAKIHCPKNVQLLEIELPMTSDQTILEKAWQKGAEIILTKIQSGKSVAFVTLGDASLYSTYSYLLRYLRPNLPEELIETVPGITAMAAAAARINTPLTEGDEPLLILPSTDDLERYLDFDNLVLMKVSRRLPELLDLLTKSQKKSVLLTRIGQDEEKIHWFPEQSQWGEEKIDYLSLMLVKKQLKEEK